MEKRRAAAQVTCFSSRELKHVTWAAAMLRIHEIIPDQHRHRDWPKGTLHASYRHAAYMGYGPQELERFWNP